MTREEKDELLSRMTLLITKTDGNLVDSVLARLWVNKCMQIVDEYE